jgi:hypothetical protein
MDVPRRSRSKWLALLIVIAVAVLLWNVAPISLVTDFTPTPTATAPSADETDASSAPVLTLGMSARSVRAIEGAPDTIEGDRWEYGPSWIRFEDGQVVDWYNSPEHALKTADASPRP